MASRRKGKAGQRKGKGGGGRSASRQRPAKLPLAAHRAFAPLLGAWGALLGAGVVVVLPEPMVAQMLRGTLIGTWAAAAQPRSPGLRADCSACCSSPLPPVAMSVRAAANVGPRSRRWPRAG